MNETETTAPHEGIVDVEGLRRLLTEASDTPWTQFESSGEEYWYGDKFWEIGPLDTHKYASEGGVVTVEPCGEKADADLIVAAVNSLPALLDEVERSRKQNEELTGWLATAEHDRDNWHQIADEFAVNAAKVEAENERLRNQWPNYMVEEARKNGASIVLTSHLQRLEAERDRYKAALEKIAVIRSRSVLMSDGNWSTIIANADTSADIAREALAGGAE